MDASSLLCIDLGSAYTKVAERREWSDAAKLVRDSHVDEEWSFCFPSLVAKVNKRGTEHWLAGQDALAQPPGDNVELFRDWKADFFASSASRRSTGEEAAAHFFQGLRDHLARLGRKSVVAQSVMRICIPKLDGSDKRGAALVKIAATAGFTPAAKKPFTYEPESNTYGVLTRGRNYTWKPKEWLGLHPSYVKMYEPAPNGLFAQIQSAARSRTKLRYSVLIVDIGSFTTDVGSLTFEMTDDPDELDRPTVHQTSTPLGIRDLDRVILEELPAGFRKAVEGRPIGEWERNKQQLYAGQAIRVRSASGDRHEVGTEAHQRAMARLIHKHAEKIGKCVTEFCKTHKIKAQETILTGGGATIQALRSQVIGALGTDGGQVTDFLDKTEPLRSLLQIWTPRGWENDRKAIDERIRLNHDLLRGGSAIGGCSVVNDLP